MEESLQQASENYSKVTLNKNGLMSDKQVNSFIAGAKWQQERSYSEKEVLNMLIEFHFKTDIQYKHNPVCIANWFEQFEKK